MECFWGGEEGTRCAHRAEEDGIVFLYFSQPAFRDITSTLFVVVAAPVEMVELQVECSQNAG